MKPDNAHDDKGGDGPAGHRRRARYAGTHPRRFDQRYKELNPERYPEIQDHVRAQGRTPAGTHVPVMVNEVLDALRPAPGDVVADCTLGNGGHAAALLERIGPTGRLIGLDVDAAQLQRTGERLGGMIYVDANGRAGAAPPRISLHRCHFGGLGKVLGREGLDGFNVILADLGVSSMQLDDPARGFSYKYDGPLDMRMDDRLTRTAADLLGSLSVDELSNGLAELADEPDHVRIARAVVERRRVEPITRTRQLARLILTAKGRRPCAAGRPVMASSAERHPVARTFQALRMMVNDEMGGLEQFLRSAPYCLRGGGRMGIISFHSGEHRRVESAFNEAMRTGLFSVVSEQPVCPTPGEVRDNPRSRSARLYGAQKTP
ncbi:MAG: 16S rRNA (cytosine(1402)-N(4))-methyltransferase RsmH [Phycisphaerales bacterium]|nr:16S rRNA (cytosine(1402)-N(4))-methyltransferase RsmH [Phycisphaerales bacterium]